ncbi:MAG: hypothetical protein L0Y50_00880 [Beijerinckiaceae bacterium]|nr:hypothetical protein [Beijerinckiaceae bacterium]
MPQEYGTEPARNVVSALPEARLRRVLDERLKREEISVIWFDTFADGLEDHLPSKSKNECVMEMILRAKRSQRLEQLYEAIALLLPDVARELQ